MIPNLFKKIAFLLFTILSISLFNQSIAQVGCSAPSSLVVNSGQSQLSLSWGTVVNAKGYNVSVAFDDGTSYNNNSLNNTVSVPISAKATSANISISTVCANGVSALLKKFIIVTQGDVNTLDCAPDPEEMSDYCDAVKTLKENAVILITFDESNCPNITMTAAAFLKLYCVEIGFGRLPASLPVKVSPNPFNQDFSIQFSLTETSAISARLYGSNGQLVKQLADQETTEAGVHNLRFETQDLPSGVYLLRLSLGNEQSLHKLMKVD